MLPERSTASMRSRPVTGSESGGPNHWGRAAARTSSTQASAASHSRPWPRRAVAMPVPCSISS